MSRLVSIWIVLLSTAALAQPAAPAPAPIPAPAPTPVPAPPAEPAPVDPKVESAKKHFENAVALFNEGNFSAALVEFQESYRERPITGVLKNIGLTQKALFRYAEAIDSLQQYLDGSPNLVVEQRDETERIISEMKLLLADVALQIVPAGAAITVDGRAVGTAPLSKALAIAAGTHTIEVTAEGYHSQKKEVMVTAGVPLTLKFELKLIPKTGKVRISSMVSRAIVNIDGRTLGVVPVELELTAGGHTLEVTAPDYHVRRDELVVAAGQTRDITVTLDRIVRKKSWYKKWYVWGSVAAVAGGVAVFGLTGGFTSQQEPLEGTLAPGAGGVQ